MILEHDFQKKVKARLKAEPFLYEFTKEAAALRGIPDIIGCYKGRFFAWELKRSAKESRKLTGRIALQRHVLRLIQKAGGIGRLVHPDNFEECLAELLNQTDR